MGCALLITPHLDQWITPCGTRRTRMRNPGGARWEVGDHLGGTATSAVSGSIWQFYAVRGAGNAPAVVLGVVVHEQRGRPRFTSKYNKISRMLSARHCAARGTGTTEQAGVQGAGGSLRPAPRKSRGAGCYQSRTRGATVMGRRRPCSRVSALPVEKSSAQEVGPVNFAWLHHGTGFLTNAQLENRQSPTGEWEPRPS